MDQNEIAVFQQAIETCEDPAKIARKVKLAFKRMPGEMALACFARVMTAELPHSIKVAVWDAVRYSHIWWGVDAVLQGPVMENPIVQQAFADAVPMRLWRSDRRFSDWADMAASVFSGRSMIEQMHFLTNRQKLVKIVTAFEDTEGAAEIRERFSSDCAMVRDFIDGNNNNILWYLTYRDDQCPQGGFACPCIERELLRLGVDPNHCNNLGLCWNDVKRHVIRPEV